MTEVIDLKKVGRIRDPVHGYVFFTGVERVILDHPIAQRLRHVAQSGMAQMVFPEVRTSRFSHSLGAMHLASQFFASSLANAEEGTRVKIEEAIEEAVEAHAGFGYGLSGDEIRELFKGQGLRGDGCVCDDRRADALVIEQGLRLAALFHDLGHLPFSHDFELALERLLKPEQPEEFKALATQGVQLELHERIGSSLAHHLQRELFGKISKAHGGRAVEVAFAVAEKILKAPAPSAKGAKPESAVDGLYQWLHSIIAGELDVDRCDYVLRDTRHYGFEFASYDLKRIVDNLIVIEGGEAHSLRLAVLPQGQSAAESFLLARFRMYQWGIRHHKVVQMAAALRKVIRDLLRPALASSSETELHQFLLDVHQIIDATADTAFAEKHPEILKRFAGYDDIWWTTKMREAAAETPDDPWIELACYRRPGPVSLWKRAIEFPLDLEEWNRKLPSKADDEASRAWEQAQTALEHDGVLVVRHSFRPWEPLDPTDADSESALGVWDRQQAELIPLTKVSSIVKGLEQAWLADLQVHAFATTAGQIEADEVIERLSAGTSSATGGTGTSNG